MITLNTRPNFLSAVYRPMNYEFTSDLSPNSIAAEKGTWTAIEIADAALVLACPGLKLGQVAILNNVAPADVTWQFAGGKVEVQSGTYEGSYTILEKITCGGSFVLVIDAEPQGDDTSGGNYAKHYPNYNAVVRINDEFVGEIDIIRLKKDSSDTFIGNVAPFLKSSLRAFLLNKLPEFGRENFNNQRVKYSVEYAEEYDDIQTDGTVDRVQSFFTDDSGTFQGFGINSTQPYFYRLDGEEKIISDLNTFAISEFSNDTFNWLSAMPSEIRVTPTQFMQMSFAYTGSVNVLTLLIKKYDSAGTLLGTQDVIASAIGQDALDTVEVYYVTPSPLSAITSDTNVAYYDLLIVDVATQLVNKVRPLRFIMDRTCTSNERNFYWLGEHSNTESFLFRGKETSKLKTTKTFQESELPAGFNIETYITSQFPYNAAEISTTFTDSLRTFTTSSGRVNRATAEWLATMFKSSSVFTEFDNVAGSAHIPININPGSISVYDTKDNFFEVSFSWSYGYKDISQNG